MKVVLDDEGVLDVDEYEESARKRYRVTAYGADFDVDGLLRRMKEREIIIPTFDPAFRPDAEGSVGGFQRQFVWSKSQMDKFVESILLGLPVPGIFLVLESDKKYLVLDGQQRLRTLQAFREGVVQEKEFSLEHVAPDFRGKTFKMLDDADRRTFNNTIIHSTVIKQDAADADAGAIYELFARINKGSTQLRPQEIRVALYRGPFVEMLRELNGDKTWRRIYGQATPSKYLKDQELILRYLALRFGPRYTSPMTEYLSDYLETHRFIEGSDAQALRADFRATCKALQTGIGESLFKVPDSTSINAAVCDSVMVGVSRRLAKGQITNPKNLAVPYRKLLRRESYLATVLESTSHVSQVDKRLKLATKAFADVR